MRKLAILGLAIGLAACSSEQPAPEADVAPFTTANGSPAGTYEYSAADGTASIMTINADGTYSQVTPDGTQGGTGTVAVVDGKTCFKVHLPGAQPLCYSEGERAEDGSFTATSDGGEALTVNPIPDPASE